MTVVIVLMRQGSAVTTDPADGTYTDYSANTVFGSGTQIGSGNYVVYKGTGTSVAVTGLTAGTTYYVAVYEYKGTVDTSGVNQGTNYKTPAATASQATGTGTVYSYTFYYTGSPQPLTIPAGAKNIQFSLKGAGGGGSTGWDNNSTQTPGENGHLVLMSYATSGVTLSIYVGGGGAASGMITPGVGGYGYHPGAAGAPGSSQLHYESYGGSGGGGSSAIVLNTTVLAESAGGTGGTSGANSDGQQSGDGGAGGGSDNPVAMDPAGGGAGGGLVPNNGGNGQVLITYE